MKERYSKYKNSGVEWIGEIPKHWVVKKMKYFAKICNGSDYKDFVLEENGYPVYGTGGVFSRCSKYLYDKISVLLGRKGSVDKPQIVTEPFWTSDTTYYTEIKDDVQPYYFFHLVNQIQFDLYIYGSAIPSMTKSVYDDMLFPYPPLSEQEQIVKYLDEKTSQIDSLIAITEKKIELLKQKRTSLINEAVTKGLNPDVELKDSGVEWIGEIPKHWVVCKLKYICNLITDGSHFSPEIEHEGRYYISVSDITKNQQIDFLNSKKINDKSFEELERNGCRPMTGDILLTKDGTIGRGTIVGDFNDFVILSSLGLIRLNPKQYNQFILQYLLSDLNVEQMYSHIRGSGITRLTIKLINDLLIIVPPLTEQEQIVKYIDTHTSEIDKLVSIEQRRIETLKEYRQSLISEVVTGKIRVYEDISEPQAS